MRQYSINDYSTVAGGGANTASGNCFIIGGGTGNTASRNASTIGGGFIIQHQDIFQQ
jgi:hypothetical protein